MKILSYLKKPDEKGATAIIVAILLLFVFIPIGALAIDLALLYVARNELQNAADAGALAGARQLYSNDGTQINTGSNLIAYNAAIANASMKHAVEVNWGSGDNVGSDVERGHWKFGSNGGFTASDSVTVINIANYTEDELNEMDGSGGLPFINAVRVNARREATPVTAFFSRLFGFDGHVLSARAVGYIGFAGTIEPEGFDYPMAVCSESLRPNGGNMLCNIGRMMENDKEGDTAAWTNFSQPCTTANAPDIRETLTPCGKGNTDTVQLGVNMGTTNGVIPNVLAQDQCVGTDGDCIANQPPNKANFECCWKLSDEGGNITCPDTSPNNCGNPTKPMQITVPVIDCSSGLPNCRPVVGAVKVNVLWVLEKENKPDEDAPCKMEGFGPNPNWENNDSDGTVRWESFVAHFGLLSPSGGPAQFAQKTIYYAPSCENSEPTGITGGKNYGILAKIPVLVN